MNNRTSAACGTGSMANAIQPQKPRLHEKLDNIFIAIDGIVAGVHGIEAGVDRLVGSTPETCATVAGTCAPTPSTIEDRLLEVLRRLEYVRERVNQQDKRLHAAV